MSRTNWAAVKLGHEGVSRWYLWTSLDSLMFKNLRSITSVIAFRQARKPTVACVTSSEFAYARLVFSQSVLRHTRPSAD